MDEEFEDLLGDGGNDADQDVRDVQDVQDAVMGERDASVPPGMPSDNELRLGRRVSELEKERDIIFAELESLKSKAKQPLTTTTVPATTVAATTATTSTTAPPSEPTRPITIPHELLPTLSLLRGHIAELSRDNHALRYTFLGRHGSVSDVEPPQASSSKITLDASEPTGEAGKSRTAVDLDHVVERVKELVRGNEELGEMVLEAGNAGKEEWENALQESKAVITSLDADLEHHLSVVQSLRAELVAYKTHFGPLPPRSVASDTPSSSRHPSSPARPPGEQRAPDPRRRDDRMSKTGIPPGPRGDRRVGVRDDRRDSGSGRAEGSRAGQVNGHGQGQGYRREEDRDYKRRR